MSTLTKRGTPRQRNYVTDRVKRGAPLLDRLMHHLRPQPNGCWHLALTPKPVTGYAGLTINGVQYLGHRLAYELLVGPIPEGLQLDHLCRNRRCVNPEHLEPVTAAENTRRSPFSNAAKTHCPSGHPYSEANTYRYKGRRYCQTCIDYRNARRSA